LAAVGFDVGAEAYDRFMGRYSVGLAAPLADLAGVSSGQRALDVGCGPGALTEELVRRLGAGVVAAIDPSEPFVEACRRRVRGADVRAGAAEQLPFADAEFDAVLSQLVVNFMSDAPAGVREMHRVARPGGVVAAAVWDYAGEMTLLRRLWDAAARVDPEGAAAHDEGRVMRYCRPDELEALWEEAGLDEVATGELRVSASYEDYDGLWAPLERGVGPAGAYVAALDEERRAALREELRRALGSPEGAFTLSARAWCVTGRAR
jgi:SAM-dependent methyltransferase